jgi:hypothetical protein
MKCEDAIEELRSAAGPAREAVLRHVAECESCRAATQAITALAAERAVMAPRLAEGAFERALQRAVQPPPRVVTNRRGFWLGTAVGGALAASIAVAVTVWWLQPGTPGAAANPQVRLALHEVRPVSVSLDSPESLQGAEIHIVLTGAIGLDGYAEQRELRWVTDLDRGVNQLTLPLVALGPNGGQVLVEVQHGDKRRAFVVDVQTTDDSARQPTAAPAQAARPAAV